MKITRIETFITKVPLRGKSFYSSQCAFGQRKSMLVRIETDDGIVGWGEGGQYGPAEPVASTIIHVLAPLLIGKDPRQPEVHWERMYTHTRDFGRKGSIIEGISAVDIALWDIFGKAHGVPVYALLGGRFRDRIRTYATGLYYRGKEPPQPSDDLEALRDEARAYVEAGFIAAKMKVGLYSPRDDLKRVEAAREVLGPDIHLMVDANHAYRAHTAIWLAKRMEDLDIFWFEEPVLPEDIEGYRQVRESTSIAIAGGECEYTRFGFAKLLTNGAVDIVQPDLCCAGGLSEARKIASLASTFNVHCYPHVWGSAVAVAAGLHFLAHLPLSPHTANPMPPFNEPMLEWDANYNPLRTELLQEPLVPNDGWMSVPTNPGLGIEVDETIVNRYVVDSMAVD